MKQPLTLTTPSPEPAAAPAAPSRRAAPERPAAPPERPEAAAASVRPDAPERPDAPAPLVRPDLDQLGDRIAERSARIQAATYDLLCDLQVFDRNHGWEGFRSCAHWLSWRTGLDLGAAREKVRVAAALADLNHIGAAMACGIISYSKVRALSRVASPVTEARLLAVACAATAEQVERLVRGWRRLDREAAAAAAEPGEPGEQVWQAQRGLSLRVDEEGMVVVRGRLLPEVGAVVQRALEAALKQVPAEAADGTEWSAAQRRADALGVVAESALAGKLDPGSAGDRYQVTVHVDAAALVGPDIAAGAISAETRSAVAAAREASAPATVAAGSAVPDTRAVSAETRSAVAAAREASAPAAAAAGSAAPDARAVSAETRSAVATAREGGAPAAVAAGSAVPDTRAISAETRSTVAAAPEASAPAATAAGSAVSDARGVSAETRTTTAAAREASAPAAVAAGSVASDAGTSSAETRTTDRTVPHATPCATGTASGAVIEQDDGLFLSTAAARRIACDAGRVLLYHAPDGSVLDVGRRTRTIPTALRRALEGRDRQRCQFPGCQNRRCDAHHLVHWADGGATRLENLVLACRFHHRAVHEEGFEVVRTGDGRFEFRRPDGAVLPAEAPAARWQGAALAPTAARLAAGGIRIGPHTATPQWYGESLDVAEALDVLWEPPPAAAS